MKKIIPLLLVVMSALQFGVGCAASQETQLQREPRDYNEAMDFIAAEVRDINKNLIGANYVQAVAQGERLVRHAQNLARFEPPRIAPSFEVYAEYGEQTQDLRRSTDRLLFMLEQRRKEDARDQLAEVAKRFNRLSVSYGPTYEIDVLDPGADRFRSMESYRSEVPGELRGNR